MRRIIGKIIEDLLVQRQTFNKSNSHFISRYADGWLPRSAEHNWQVYISTSIHWLCSERHSSHFNVFWRNGKPSVVLKAREIACRLEGSRASSLVTTPWRWRRSNPGGESQFMLWFHKRQTYRIFARYTVYIKCVHFISYAILSGVRAWIAHIYICMSFYFFILDFR